MDPEAPPPPPDDAQTADQFDTTDAADRAEALSAAPSGLRLLGETLATLGAPTDPGIWLKTPLVSGPVEGQIDHQGRSVSLELRPSGGAVGSGSQISLAAMRLLEVPLTGILELEVFGP